VSLGCGRAFLTHRGRQRNFPFSADLIQQLAGAL
jgi:hypothetical protein